MESVSATCARKAVMLAGAGIWRASACRRREETPAGAGVAQPGERCQEM